MTDRMENVNMSASIMVLLFVFLVCLLEPVGEGGACQAEGAEIVLHDELGDGVDVCLEDDGAQAAGLLPFLVSSLCRDACAAHGEEKLAEDGEGDVA